MKVYRLVRLAAHKVTAPQLTAALCHVVGLLIIQLTLTASQHIIQLKVCPQQNHSFQQLTVAFSMKPSD